MSYRSLPPALLASTVLLMSIATAPGTIAAQSAAAQRHSSVARQSSPAVRRLIAAAVAFGSGAVLAVAAWLTPSAAGVGTHQQLHLPACGWIAIADMPCPTCGMTTAFAHAAHGHLWLSFVAQPLGCTLAIATAMAFLVSIYVVLTASHVGWAFTRLWGRSSGWMLSAIVVAAWAYKFLSYKGWI